MSIWGGGSWSPEYVLLKGDLEVAYGVVLRLHQRHILLVKTVVEGHWIFCVAVTAYDEARQAHLGRVQLFRAAEAVLCVLRVWNYSGDVHIHIH